MKTSKKNFITMGVFWVIAFVFNVGGCVATRAGHASTVFWVVTGILAAFGLIFFIAGIGATVAEER